MGMLSTADTATIKLAGVDKPFHTGSADDVMTKDWTFRSAI